MRITESQLRRIIRQEIARSVIAESRSPYGHRRRFFESSGSADRDTEIVMDWYGEWKKNGGDFKKISGKSEDALGNFNEFDQIKNILEKQGVLKDLSDDDLDYLKRTYRSAYDSKWG